MEILKRLREGATICITNSKGKQKLLKSLDAFYQIEFLTKQELQKKLLYEYHKEALYQFCQEYDLIPENGKIFLDSMYAITKKEQDSVLFGQKEWLKKQNLLITHPYFLEQLKKKQVLIYGYEEYEMKFLSSILKQYTTVQYIEDEAKKYIPTITEYETLEEEVVGVAEQISMLLKKGVSINRIYLGNVTNDYHSIIERIFHTFKIPIEASHQHVLYEYPVIQTLLKKISWEEPLTLFEPLLQELKQEYPKTDSVIFETLISIINKYYQKNRTFKEIKEIFIYELKQAVVKQKPCSNLIKQITVKDHTLEKEDYLFIIGASLGELSTIYEDQDYFSDIKKEQLGLPTSLEMTLGEENKIKRKITSIPHIFISYKKKSPFKEYLRSPLLEEWSQEIKKGEYQYTNQAYNEYLLNASIDPYLQFNQKSEHLKRYGIEKVYYHTYHNQFTKIDPELFQKYFPFCVLSYTGMQKFFECPFHYYIESILKIKPPIKQTPGLMIGNVFHFILEQYFKGTENLEKLIEEQLNTMEITPISKKQFYLKKYKVEIKRLIEIMEEQLKRSSMKPTYLEEHIEWIEKKKITFRLFGKIDKIMTVEDEDHCYIIVIDYKTGQASSDLSKVVYGLDMQLLLYLYLIQCDPKFSKYQLGGAYLEHIVGNVLNYTNGKTYEDLLWDQSRLDGISIQRREFIKRLDHFYQGKSYVKGVRVKSDGEFYASNKVLEPATLDQLLEIVRRKIDQIEEKIEKAEFFVAPKKFSSEIGDKVSSCEHCPYRDICYLKPNDVIRLKEYKNLEFLKEEAYE